MRHLRNKEIRAGVVALTAIVVFTAFVFTKSNPFTRHFEVTGVFSTAATLRSGSDVRIGGQKVGEVTRISRGPAPRTSSVTMRISRREPALRTDARLALRPRLALEGNGYVRVEPGSPDRPELEAGASIPLAQTSVAVQIDQAISTFDQPTRTALSDSIREFAGGLGTVPRSARTPRPGSVELQRAVRALGRALPPAAVASRAVRGTQLGDLPAALGQTGALAEQLAENPDELQGFITEYATFSRSLASRDAALRSTISGLATTLSAAPQQLRAIDAALPDLTRFADELTPALRAAPPAFRALGGTAREVSLLSRPAELPALLRETAGLTRAVPVLQRRLGAVLPQVASIGRCLTKTVVPALNGKIDDGRLSTGEPVWKEALYMASALAGAASAFDANGGTLRLGVTESEQAVGINTGTGPLGTLSGVAPDGDVGLNPTWLGAGVKPAMRPDQPCEDQPLPDYDARRKPGMPQAFRPEGRAAQRQTTAEELAQLLRDARDPRTQLEQALEATP